jgi:murein DD-endopeptidase MepM/ murein hydrolase activator NlpD
VAFRRPRRGLLDFLLVLLCLWAAAYHTPPGALVRGLLARLVGVRTSALPLLAYYTGGAGADAAPAAGGGGAPGGLAPPRLRPAASAREALAWGLHAVLEEPAGAAAARRAGAGALLGRAPGRGGVALLAGSARASPEGTRAALDAVAARLGPGGEAAAVAAFFFGEPAARFALQRAQASGGAGGEGGEGGEGGGARGTPDAGPGLAALRPHLPPGSEEPLALTARALMLGTAYALRWPAPERAPVTSPFGARAHPLLGGVRMHEGVDVGLPPGTPVRAAAGGRVLRASEDAVNGRLVVLDHGHGVTSAYLHNSALEVRAGEQVQPGQVVARSGSTGRSSGPHLHYQVELAGEAVDPLRLHGLGSPPPPAPPPPSAPLVREAAGRGPAGGGR